MVEIKWQDPPASKRGMARSLVPIVTALKNNPGKWALVREKASSSSACVPWRKQGCEALVRRTNFGETPARYDVYARWPEKVLPLPEGTAGAKTEAAAPPAAPKAPAAKAAVEKAIATGTALTPPPSVAAPKSSSAPKPANDMGLQSFLEARRARGAAR